jgi:6-phosphogluconolactonase (cycloisomerase 2 family)
VAVISGFDKNSLSGALSAIPTSPFPAHEAAPMAVDGQGKFLFVAGPTSIAMYAIDPASGALTEVPSSPFPYIPTINPSQAPSNPLSIATEPTGEYVYVGFQNALGSPYSSITPYLIDTSNAADPVLDLGPQLELDFTDGAPANLFVDPTGRHLYVALGNTGGNFYSGFDLYDLDGSSGALTLTSTLTVGAQYSKSSAMDPAGRFLFQSVGQIGCTLISYLLSPVDGTSTGASSLVVDYSGDINGLIAVDPSGNFLYFAGPGGPATLSTYSIDQTNGALTLLSAVQTPYPFGSLTVADPQGPYLYTLLNGALHGFQADPTSGVISELPGSPFTDGSANTYATGLYITNTNPQASSGPYLELSGGGGFPQTPVGQSSSLTVGLSNLGNITMSLTSVAVVGDSTGSFSLTSTCSTVLTPNASCQATITFTPTAAGLFQATLQITDNAPGSPQSLALSGTATSPATPQPQVSLSAGSLSFGSQTQGTSSTAQVITLTNSGNATLHFLSSITLNGTYAKDWSQTNTCNAPLTVQGTCTISVIFSPSDNGILTASISINDDAPNSPQVINLYGNALPAALLSPATSGGSTVATVTAGNTATYNLQAVPGPSFTGTINLTCSGVPFGAQCTIPSSLPVANGAVVPFTVTISTLSSSQAALFPSLPNPPSGWLRPQPGFPLAFFAALLLFALALRLKIQMPAPARWLVPITTLLLVTVFVFSGIGCGGSGSAQTQVQPPLQSAATPAIQPASGTYTAAQSITITDATAGAAIHYTTDGTTPTASSATYQAAIPLTTLTTVQAMATAPNYANSGVASATFKFQTPSGTITITPTATPNGSAKPLPLTSIQLTLNVQ